MTLAMVAMYVALCLVVTAASLGLDLVCKWLAGGRRK